MTGVPQSTFLPAQLCGEFRASPQYEIGRLAVQARNEKRSKECVPRTKCVHDGRPVSFLICNNTILKSLLQNDVLDRFFCR